MVRRAKTMSLLLAGLLAPWQVSTAAAQQGTHSPTPAAQATDYVMQMPRNLAPIENERSTLDGESTELIKERYSTGAIKVEREVTQDAHGNYVNHGPWKMYDQKGALMAQGEYQHGNRTGEWIRWYRSVTETDLLAKPPYQQYVGPFISQASFTDGQLDGAWIIYDGKKHRISEFTFKDGRRDGPSIWYHPNGRKLREIMYRDGEMHGNFIEYSSEGTVTLKDAYQDGRKLASKSSNHNGQGAPKKSEGTYLFAKEVEQTPDDWWNCKLMTTTKTGKDEKHGQWTSWHSNGQKQLEGTYEHDVQTGKFSWWHSNGQKALEGNYIDGKQDGSWTWWYATGQKSIAGEYSTGNPTGRWTWWKEDGKVTQSADLSHSEGVVIETPKMLEPSATPRTSKPLPKQQPPVKR